MSVEPIGTESFSSPAALLTVRHLVKHFPSRTGGKVVRAVDDVSFELSTGETLALVGESGCGKSTTGRLILRLLSPTSGAIDFCGKPVAALQGAALQAYRQHVQIIFQDPFSSLDPRMSVEQIIGEPLVVHRAANRHAIHQRVRELLQLVGLSVEHAHRYPHQFSGGQRQRIGIARALALSPQLIVCDEPLSALDVSVQAQIINLLADLQQRLHVAYLFISHNLAVVRHLAHRVAVMYLGRIVELGTVDQIFNAPRHPYTQALLNAVPVPDPEQARERRSPAGLTRLEGDAVNPVDIPAGCRFHPSCPFTQDVCRSEDPALFGPKDVAQAACHRANDHPRYKFVA